jgi:aminomethyltransferase
VDDIIIWWISENNIHVMPNASNTEGVLSALTGGRDITTERAIIAVQGPTARALVAKVAPDVAGVKRRTVGRIRCAGADCIVAGTGYTGEDGVELAVPAEDAKRVWESLLEAGVMPAGLGARDTLRLEAGLPLHGHELGPTISPLEAGLAWVVAWDKADFVGREALLNLRESGLKRTLVGIATVGRRPPRDGATVEVNGEQVGIVTSGNFSPVLGHGIALALVAPQTVSGPCEIRVRDTVLSGNFVPLPFVAHRG